MVTLKSLFLHGVKFVPYVFAFGVLAFAWQTNERLSNENKHLRDSQRELAQSVNRPILIHGFTIPLLAHVDMVEDRRASTAPERKLILVYKTGCGTCRQQLPIWEQMVSDARLANTETWIVAYGEARNEVAPLLNILNRRNLAYRLMKVRAANVFAVATGIGFAPVTLVTRGLQDEVEFVAPGLADKSELSIILDNMTGLNASRGARIEGFRVSEPL